MTKILALILFALISLAGCRGGGVSAHATMDVPLGGTGSPRAIEQSFKVGEAGTVRYIDLEGGFFAIVGGSGQRYDPINLPQEYKQDGLRVRFEGRVRKDVMGTHMYGTNVEIIKIEKL